MLEYDNSAFYYFALTLLSIYLVPGTYFCLKEVWIAFSGGAGIGMKARTIAEKKKIDEVNGTTTGFARLSSNTFLFRTTFLMLAWSLFLYLVSLVGADGEVERAPDRAVARHPEGGGRDAKEVIRGQHTGEGGLRARANATHGHTRHAGLRGLGVHLISSTGDMDGEL